MRIDEKKQVVEQLADKLARCSIAITTDYRGILVAEMTDLRRRLRQRDIEFRVVKNTLVAFAAEKADKSEFMNVVEGPTAVAFGYGDIIDPARAVVEYIRSSGSVLKIRGALVGRRAIGATEVTTLANMPPKEVLVAKLLGGVRGPIVGLVNVLSANLTGLAYVLDARRRQLEGGSSD